MERGKLWVRDRPRTIFLSSGHPMLPSGVREDAEQEQADVVEAVGDTIPG